MIYPEFEDLMKNIPIGPARNVYKRFPESTRDLFEMSVNNDFYAKKILEEENPLVGGMVFGKRDGVFQRDSSVIGLGFTVIEDEHCFVSPFYADSKSRVGYIDCGKAIYVQEGLNFSKESLDEINSNVLELREDERLNGLVSKLALESVSAFIGYQLLGGMFGISDKIEEFTGLSKDVQSMILALGVSAYELRGTMGEERDEKYSILLDQVINHASDVK